MQVEFTKDEIIKLLEEYYKRLEDREVKVTITTKKEYSGWRDEQVCVTIFTVIEKLEVAGMMKEVKQILSKDQVKDCLTAVFGLYDFNLKDMTINSSLNSRWEGYGYNEHEVLTPCFKNITIQLEKRKNVTLSKTK